MYQHDSRAFDDLLVAAASWVLLATLGWGALLVLAAVAERVSHGRLPALDWAGCPRRARPLLLAIAGAAVLAPGAAHADDLAPDRSLPVPTRPADDGTAAGPTPASRPAPAPATAAAAVVTVRPGDSLWALAQRRLGAGATPANVAALVTRLHHRNLAVVGDDPDLLHPGQQLRFPVTPPPPEAP